MLSVDEALDRVMSAAARVAPLEMEDVPLDEAEGRILREQIVADRDMPPFTRSAMDGYAVRSADAARAPITLRVVEEIPAGRQPEKTVGPGEASVIMTGGALPHGADAVQMVEKTEPDGTGSVRILAPVAAGEHVRHAGEDLRAGSLLLEAGGTLSASDIALLASAGRQRVRVSRRVRVSILPTGDELVPPGADPKPAQIRESNGHALRSLVRRAGALPRLLDIARDTREDLLEKITRALTDADVLLLSGGVSMGTYDLVGAALTELGCRPVFDRVAIQPGKPLFFATLEAGSGAGPVLVFGLPGNPVSTVIDFLVFARPALRRIAGAAAWMDLLVTAKLEKELTRHTGRRGYLPAALTLRQEGLWLRLLPSMGSGDMVALSRADALAIIPEDAARLEAGVTVRALPLRSLTTP